MKMEQDDLNNTLAGEAEHLNSQLLLEYNNFKRKNLKLDMSRGKPCKEQLDLSDSLYEDTINLIAEDGTDCRNYGTVEGLYEARRLFAEMFELEPEELIVANNSSLALMYDTIARAYLYGLSGNDLPWSRLPKVKFLCPVPGYDRHFSICELFGIEMIPVPMFETGPCMDLVEQLAACDSEIKGIWCIPLYSNPTGVSFSESTVKRLAEMKTAAKDFLIIWDNAYAIHHLYREADAIPNLIKLCRLAGNPDRAIMFSSTSKITWPGSGIAILASNVSQIERIKKLMSVQSIGPDKVTQLMHVRFLGNMENVKKHMRRHADILRPKFDLVLEKLDEKLSGSGLATWNRPRGGYFISLDVVPGTAKRVVQLAKEAGVVLTSAGATHPLGVDPLDRNIRIAPTYPPIDELGIAIEILCCCVKIAALELR